MEDTCAIRVDGIVYLFVQGTESRGCGQCDLKDTCEERVTFDDFCREVEAEVSEKSGNCHWEYANV